MTEIDKDALLVHAALTILSLECEIEKLQQKLDDSPITLESVWKKNVKVSINPRVLRQSKWEHKKWHRNR